MKRYLAIFAISMMAVVSANAAAVTWSMTQIANSPDSTASGDWICYILDSSNYTTFSTLTQDKFVDYVTKNSIYSGSTVAARGNVSLSIKNGKYEKGDTISSFLVLFNNSNAKDATYYVNTCVSSTTINDLGADGTIKFGTFTEAMSADGSSGGWVSIPEPTSGLLILLGMAGLVLRRKQK